MLRSTDPAQPPQPLLPEEQLEELQLEELQLEELQLEELQLEELELEELEPEWVGSCDSPRRSLVDTPRKSGAAAIAVRPLIAAVLATSSEDVRRPERTS